MFSYRMRENLQSKQSAAKYQYMLNLVLVFLSMNNHIQAQLGVFVSNAEELQ